ncbi:hypothetical protein WBJ53_16060 [Spirosoma sp. SC4-14]|uniref:hypothetical protein n=1 Tax=Spirosoma sp. SC4-14 TaxID=3128900 RepID=UPI0030D08DEB
MKYLLFGCLWLIPCFVWAQNEYYKKKDSSTALKRTYAIILNDGTQLRGELVHQDSVEAVIRTGNLGEIRLRADQIVRIEQLGSQAQGEVYPNLFPQTMRLVPTAFSAERGKLYYRNYYLYISQFEYGVTDNWSVGTTFYSFLPTNLFSVNTKLTVPVGSQNRVRVGINAQYAAVRFDGILEGIGYVQGIVTTGDRQNNTTYGLGWSLSGGEVSRNVVGTFGLVRKVSPKLTFISENFILIGSGSVDFAGVLSAGIRFDRRRHAFDLAAYIPLIIGPTISTPVTLIPFGSYHLRIGK